MAAADDNKRGFWERTDVVDLNDQMLAELDMNWFTLRPEIQAAEIDRLCALFAPQIEVISARLSRHQSWFLKDPRMSITWPVWTRFLNVTDHLVVHRHPVSVARSLQKRNGIALSHGLVFWYHQTRMIAAALTGLEVKQLIFNDIEADTSTFQQVINQILDSDVDLAQLDAADVAAVFDPKLVSQDAKESDLLDSFPQVAHAWSLVQQNELESLAKLPVIALGTFDWRELDSSFSLHCQIEKQARDHTLAAEHIANLEHEQTRLRDNLEDLRLELSIAHRELSDVQTELSDTQTELRDAQTELSDAQREISEFNDVVAELNRRLLEIGGEVKTYMGSKRYFVGAVIGKLKKLFRLQPGPNLYHAMDVATYGHSAVDLEQVLPKVSARRLLISMLIRNPGVFLRKLSVNRLRKGLALLWGRGEVSASLDHALLQYSSADLPHSATQDIFDPDEANAWRDQPLTFEPSVCPKVSIIIPVYNNYLTTLSCLHSIAKHTASNEIEFEIIIADDCSTDETATIEDRVSGLTVVRGKQNVGFLKNCNHAMSHAKGEFAVLLNNDTNVQENWLTELVAPLEEDASIGITGPMFLYPDGRVQEAGGIIFNDASGWNYGRLDKPEKPEYSFARDVDYVSGACLVFRMALWHQVNGFDDRFAPAYYEDTDFCFAARDKGQRVRYVPTARVVHFEGVSHGNDETAGIKQYQVVNKEKFAHKWKQVLADQHYVGPEALFSARVHGRGKPVLLFIDHHVPFYDKDAGSKVAQRYIELFIEQGVHVIFLGDNFYPHQPYTAQLQALGVEVLYGDHYKKNWFEWYRANASRIDAVYLNRPHISINYLHKIKSVEQVPFIAYHGADLHYIRVAREEKLGVNSDGGLSSEEWKKIEYELMRGCDVSMWLSAGEVNLVANEDPSINCSYMPMYWFEKEDLSQFRGVAKCPNLLFVGGFGHPPNLDGLMWFMDNVYPHVIESHPNTKLTVIGSNCPPQVEALRSELVDIRGYVTEDELIQAYKEARVAIVPLRYGAGVKGKVIESMKYGVPVLTTTIGAEGLPGIVGDYLTVSDDPHEYALQLRRLLDDDELCATKISMSDSVLLESYSRQSALTAIREILGQARG
ncbi:hypothetical protein GCM10008090_04800 [Arenicella chitinivorans]|uniref:Glycosyltransferase 2-like domain-containing protein n=2 Tax=Arenicella chitinivorans TaxID=1329800 RepID=A0A918VGD3_9GAMM|nr:hypothetical protein GCM10008090_04800 [Arenicella chitinivorans]